MKSSLTCLLFLFVFYPISAFNRRLLLRVRCYNHTSGDRCDEVGERCNRDFKICLSRSTGDYASCIGSQAFTFTNSTLGTCAPNIHRNFPDPIVVANLSTSIWDASLLYLRIKIVHSRITGIAHSTQLTHILKFNLTSVALPESPFGEAVTPSAVPLFPYNKNSSAPAPAFQLDAALECPPFMFGTGCSQKCVTNATQLCFANGTAACRGECLKPVTSPSATELMTGATSMGPIGDTTTYAITTKVILSNPIIAVIGILCVIIVALVVIVVVNVMCRRKKNNKNFHLPTVRFTAAPTQERPLPRTIGSLANERKASDCAGNPGLRVNLASPYDNEPEGEESVYEEVGPIYCECRDSGEPYDDYASPTTSTLNVPTRFSRR